MTPPRESLAQARARREQLLARAASAGALAGLTGHEVQLLTRRQLSKLIEEATTNP